MKVRYYKIEPYARTPIFSEETVPKEHLKFHINGADEWQKIVIEEGELTFQDLNKTHFKSTLTSGKNGWSRPGDLHRVVCNKPVKFYIEYYRKIERQPAYVTNIFYQALQSMKEVA